MSPDASADAAVVFPSDRTEDSSGDDLLVDVGVLGTVVRIRTVDTDFTALVRRAWHLALAPGTGREVPEDRTITMTDVEVLGSDAPSERRSRAMVALTQRVTFTALRARAGQAVFFHAGGICDPRTGAAFVYVAPGGTGKTTLTRSIGPGLGYLSDETVAVRADGSVMPYLKPLSIRRGGDVTLKDEVAPGELGLRAPAASPWIAGLVILRRQDGARLERKAVTTLDAIAALSPETSALAALDHPFRRLADVLERAGGLEIVTYSEADQLRSLVDEVLRRTR
jgi:hypothetical protein